MRLVPIECVKNNSILARDIYGYNGDILLTSGSVLTDKIIKRIKDLGIFSIYIQYNYEDTSIEIEDIIKPELRQKAITTVKETFSDIKQCSLITNNNNKDYWHSIDTLVDQLINDVINNKHTQVTLVDIKNLDNYTYSHCVNVAAISLVLGISLNLNTEELRNLCTGALLHDIGKVFIPPEIVQKKNKLTSEEFDIIKTHCKLGFEFIQKLEVFNPIVQTIILQHHERIDGLGYPNQFRGDEINYLARIVSIADVYDALTSDRPYKRAFCPNDAVEYIMCNAGQLFDFNIVDVFSKIIVAYPTGTLVKLSNGDSAIVEKTIPYYPLRPIVKITQSTSPERINTSLNLIKNLSIVISYVIYDT